MQHRQYRVVRRRISLSFAALCFCTALPILGKAATFTWTGASPFSNSWTDVFNWTGLLVPLNNGTADLSFGATGRTSPFADQNWNLHGITFTASAPAYFIQGGILTLQGGGLTNGSSAGQLVLNSISLGASQTWSASSGILSLAGLLNVNGFGLGVTGNFDINLASIVSGNGNISKSGAGVLTLSTANTYTGTLNINGGSVKLASGLALQDAVTAINTDNGLNLNAIANVSLAALNGKGAFNVGTTILQLGNTNLASDYGGIFSGSGKLLKYGSGVAKFTGGTAVTHSSLYRLGVNSGTVVLDGAHIDLASTSSTGSGDEALSIGDATLNVLNGAVASGAANSRIVMDGTSSNLLVSGAGSQVHCGFQFSIGLGGTASAIVESGGRIATDSNFVVGLQGTANGSITVRSGGHVNAGSSILGAIASSAGTATITDAGSDWTAGYLGLGGLSAAQNGGTGKMLVKNGGAVTINGTTEIWNDKSSLVIDKGSLSTASLHSVTGNAAIQVSDPVGGTGLTVGLADTTSNYDSVIVDGPSGSGGLKKVGSGTLTLTGFNTYTGRTTVAGGILSLSGGSKSSFTVNSGTHLFLENGVQVDLGFGDIIANGAVSYDNVTVTGGFLRGSGHNISGSATFNGTTSSSSAVIAQPQAATMNNFTNGGRIENGAVLTAGNFYNRSSGILNVGSTVNATEFSSDGLINVATNGTLNSSGSSLVLGAGSRTNIGTPANHGGTITLGGSTLELNGGLLVNNGTISGGLVNINYGGLAKGVGSYAGGYSVNDGGKIIFGNSPGTLHSGSATWGSGGSFDFQINDANGVAGTNWGLNDITGTLTLTSGTTDASQFTISLNTLTAANGAGTLGGFNANQSYIWTFATTTGGVVGFDPAEFALDTSGFLNATNGTFSIDLGSGGKSLQVEYHAVPEPSSLAVVGVGLVALLRRKRK